MWQSAIRVCRTGCLQVAGHILRWLVTVQTYSKCGLTSPVPCPQASKWTSDDLYRHAAFCEEWLFRVAAPEPYPLGARLEVVDLKGMRFTDIGSGWFSWCGR